MDLKELCESVSIVGYIGKYVELEQKGDEFWGLSPFKEENTPSFSVREETHSWYDFSSGHGGNLYTFVKEYHKCRPSDAVEIIKEYAGVSGDPDILNPRTTMAANVVAKQYATRARKYSEPSGKILPEDYMQRFSYDEDKLSVWINEGISVESLKKYSVAYDQFQNKLIYPVRNVHGEIINVCGRTLDTQWKEKGIPKYIYRYPLGRLDTLGGLFENRACIEDAGEVIVFEGIKSVMKMDTWGIYNSCCIYTSHLNPHQMIILMKLGVKVVFALDKGVDISADVNIKRLKRYVNVEYIKDMDGLIQEKDSPADCGYEVFKRLYDGRRKLR